jgi:hypothetical protein
MTNSRMTNDSAHIRHSSFVIQTFFFAVSVVPSWLSHLLAGRSGLWMRI